MMFKFGENDFISLLNIDTSPTVRDEIDGFCGSPGQDDFVRPRCIDELAHLLGGGRTGSAFDPCVGIPNVFFGKPGRMARDLVGRGGRCVDESVPS